MKPTPTLDPDHIVQRTKDVLFSQLDDELLAIDAQAGYCYCLNETAGRVWELIAAPTPIRAMCVQLQQEFIVDEATCQRQVLALLSSLCEAGLVQVNDVPVA